METSGIALRIREIKEMLPAGVRLVAVSKFQSIDSIKAAYEAGQRLFGESRVQELLEKRSQLPDDIQWHFIGHLQTNKVRQLIGHATLIESVDSERLLDLIDAESRKKNLVTQVLLQVHVAKEETKFGFSPDEIREYFREKKYERLSNTLICGMMAMATNTDDMTAVRADFAMAAHLLEDVRKMIPINPLTLEPLLPLNILSMGMSGDWPLAVEEGANMIRVGSSIFGERVNK